MMQNQGPQRRRIEASDLDPVEELESGGDQRTHYQNHDHNGQPDHSRPKRRAGALLAAFSVILIFILVFMFSYMIP